MWHSLPDGAAPPLGASARLWLSKARRKSVHCEGMPTSHCICSPGIRFQLAFELGKQKALRQRGRRGELSLPSASPRSPWCRGQRPEPPGSSQAPASPIINPSASTTAARNVAPHDGPQSLNALTRLWLVGGSHMRHRYGASHCSALRGRNGAFKALRFREK